MPYGKAVTKKEAEMVIQIALTLGDEIREKGSRARKRPFPSGVKSRTAKLSGLSSKTVARILAHYEQTGEAPDFSKTPRDRKPVKATEHAKMEVRNHIRTMMLNGEVPTVDKVHRCLNEQSSASAAADGSALPLSRSTTYNLMRSIAFT